MARKHLLSGLGSQKLPAGNSSESASNSPTVSPVPQFSPRGAIGAVSRSIEYLKAQSVVELDPDLIDEPAITDRLEEATGRFDEFAAQIKEHGQQVPILVRPHPTIEGRYQIAYGRRRRRAVKQAGRFVRAIVKPLTDEELVLAQGQENSARADLSFIERALYAAQLEATGYSRDLIMAALAVDKTGLSRLIAVAVQIPGDIIRAIGPAPKAGRDRWTELASRLERKGSADTARALLSADGVTDLASDDRFVKVFDAIAPKKAGAPRAKVWKAEDGTRAARIKEDDRTLTLMINKKAAPEFSDYLLAELPEIYAAFKRHQGR